MKLGFKPIVDAQVEVTSKDANSRRMVPFVGPWKRHDKNPVIKREGKERYLVPLTVPIVPPSTTSASPPPIKISPTTLTTLTATDWKTASKPGSAPTPGSSAQDLADVSITGAWGLFFGAEGSLSFGAL